MTVPLEKRRKLTAPVDGEIWEKYHGHFYLGKCHVCKDRRMTPFTYQYGFKIAYGDGGMLDRDNIVPVCLECEPDMRYGRRVLVSNSEKAKYLLRNYSMDWINTHIVRRFGIQEIGQQSEVVYKCSCNAVFPTNPLLSVFAEHLEHLCGPELSGSSLSVVKFIEDKSLFTFSK